MTDRSEATTDALREYGAVREAVDQVRGMVGDDAPTWLKCCEPSRHLTAYIVSDGLLFVIAGEPDRPYVATESNIDGAATTPCTCLAVPIMRGARFTLSVARVENKNGARCVSSWTFQIEGQELAVALPFDDKQIHDPASFAHALARQVVQAQRHVDSGP